MNKDPRIPILLVALFAAGILLWLASLSWRPSGGAHAVSELSPPSGGLPEPAEESPRTVERVAEATSPGWRRTREVQLAPEPVPSEAFVTVLVQNSETGMPIEGALVGISENGSGGIIQGRTSGVAGESLYTGTDGRVVFRVPPKVPLSCLAFGPGREGEFVSKSVPLDSLEPTQRVQMKIALDPARRSFDFFRLVDRETEAPIEGARVLRSPAHSAGGFNTLDSPAKDWNREAEVLAVSDGEGLLRLPFLSTRSKGYELHAPGYSPCILVPSGESVAPDHPTLVRLAQSASLVGAIEMPGVRKDGDLTIAVIAGGFSLIDLESSPWSYLVKDRQWSTTIAPDGTYRLDGLPANVELQLEIRAGEGTLHHHGPSIELAPGEERRFDWSKGAGSAVFGRVLDTNGNLAGRDLWLVGARRALPIRMISRFDEPAYVTKTDESGGFRFEDVVPGGYYVGESPARSLLASSFAVFVKAPTSEEIVLEPTKEWTIEGQVVFQGDGVDHVEVHATREDVWGLVRGEVDEAGAFRLSLPVEGPWYLSAMQISSGDLGVHLTDSPPLSVQTGTDNVRLEMVASARLAGRTEDESGGAIRTRFVLLPRSPGASSLAGYDYRSHFDYDDLRPGRYAIYVASPDGLAAVSREVLLGPGQEILDFVVVVHPAVALRLEDERSLAPRTAFSLTKDAELMANLYLFGKKSGTFWVPPGTYRFEVRAARSSELLSTRNLTLVVGEEAMLEIDR